MRSRRSHHGFDEKGLSLYYSPGVEYRHPHVTRIQAGFKTMYEAIQGDSRRYALTSEKSIKQTCNPHEEILLVLVFDVLA